MQTESLRTACYEYERRIEKMSRLLIGMWRDMDVARLRGTLPDDLVNGWAARLEEEVGVHVE